MKHRAAARLAIVAAAVLLLALPALAQRGGRRFFSMMGAAAPIKYDGRFTIVRLGTRAIRAPTVRLPGNSADPDRPSGKCCCLDGRAIERDCSGWL